ncbi:Ig-like domain-containing protein [Sphingomonas sp. GCM10030256]|uniref:Ig-like domain-containing protein n=1 Tax=Sphingomonas sp. GCM10030256 TaxID=3273427 RepID=UPI003616310E
MALVLRSDSSALLENGGASGNVLQNDSDALRVTQIKAGAGTYVPVTSAGTTLQGVFGTLTIMADGSYSYAANLADRLRAGATGSDTFTYGSTDGTASGSTTLKFTVTGINDAPVLTSTSVSLPSITEDQTSNTGRKVSVFLASTDADSTTKGIAITSLQSGNGQWQYSIDGRATWLAVGSVSETNALLLRGADYVRFVPDGVSGTTAGFTFRAWDQTSGTAGAKADASTAGGQAAFSVASGTASIVVGDGGNGNSAPVGIASTASGIEDGPAITGQVQASDADNNTLTYAFVANSAVGGSVSINSATGAYSFTPSKDFSGTASFRFTASDGSLTSSPAQVTITIAPVNDAPVANADSASTIQGAPVLIDVLANDTDVDGDPLSIAAIGNAANGMVEIENGQVRYTPNAGFSGNDAFSYTVSDGVGGTAQGSVGVSVGTVSTQQAVVSLTFRQGADGYFSAVDTMLRMNRPTTSYADAAVLRASTDGSKGSDILLRFGDLFGSESGQVLVGAQILSASLQLQVTGASTNGGTMNRMLVNWDGSSTWNSLGTGVQVNGVEASSTGISLGAVALGARILDVTDSLLAWNGAGSTSAQKNAANLGWLFNPSSTDFWEFSSSQGAVKPVLTVTYVQGAAPTNLPTVSINAASQAVENAGKVTFNLSLSQAATQAVTVTFSTVDHTAEAGSDYVSLSQSVTFLAGQTTKSFDVNLVNDSVGERLETFTVQINSATNARIDAAVAVGKIKDDDVATPPMPALNPTVVATYNIADGSKYRDGGSGSYGIGDPSGLAYIPSLGTLLVADSEHDESPYNSSTNLFAVGLDGSYIRNHSLLSFTKEPTGLAYNSSNGLLYVADDDAAAVSWVSPTNPSVRLGFFDTARVGLFDTEDMKFDPLTGNLHILDGSLRLMFELTPSGEYVNSIPLPSVMKDAEALAYDSVHDIYFVAAGSALIWAMDPEGNVLATIDLLSTLSRRPSIKGLELAPSSNPNDGDTLSLYVADYGSDQVNDGRLFELSLGPDWF